MHSVTALRSSSAAQADVTPDSGRGCSAAQCNDARANEAVGVDVHVSCPHWNWH